MIKVAMVGLGRWGQTILNSIQGKSGRLRVVHGVSKEPELAGELAARHGFRLSTDLDDAIADPQVQAVLLATPHSLHVEQIRRVAAAGKPVWCEKPLALTRAEAERAIQSVRAAGVPLGSGNNKRCFASMRELKRVVESGAMGKVLHVEGHFSNEHSTRVAGGATGVMATVRAAPMFWRVHVFGTDGSAEARGEDTLIVTRIGGQPQQETYPHVDSLRVLLEAFADAIEGKAPFPVTPEQILDVIGAFEAVITSLARGKPVELTR